MNDATQTEAPVLVRTFLIADIRGYSRFTQERGDEAAARLATAFADITRDGVSALGGEVIELRGDEALGVFASARGAIRAAAELQDRYAAHSHASPDLPLAVGIGIDAGEAVPVDGGFRGGALNVAARLCSLAQPGEILATEVVIHLARKVEGLSYTPRGEQPLKGMDVPVRVIAVGPEGGALVPTSARPPIAQRQLSPEIEPDEFLRQFGALVNQRVAQKLSRTLAEGLPPEPVIPRIPGGPQTPSRARESEPPIVTLFRLLVALIITLAAIGAFVFFVAKVM